MEKEMMDKIDKIRNDLREKIILHNKRYDEFHKEFFTDDMKKIVKDLLDNGIDICCDLNDEYKFRLNSASTLVIIREKMGDYYLNISEYCGKDYDNASLRQLKNQVEIFNQSEKRLNAFIDNADLVIKFISDKYTGLNNNRADLINEIMDLLDVDEPKEKHVKITVEWS